jgi:RNA polymerase sigma-70 factor (ECF subfamily)
VNEQVAVARLQRGDIRGLEVLVQTYQVSAVRAAFLITRDRPLSEDIVQSAFIRAYERIAQFDPARPFGPWFLRIVVNDALKAAGRGRRLVPLDALSDESGEIPLAHADPDPEALFVRGESDQTVWAALEELPPEQRAAIIMRYYLEIPEQEAADRLGVPPGTIKSRLHTARRKLKSVLGDRDG